MMYSDIVGEAYHGIGLSKKHSSAVDIFFFSAAHHRWRMNAAAINHNWEHFKFHHNLFVSHLKALLAVISEHGDFSQAVDPTKRGLDSSSGWDFNARFKDVDLFDLERVYESLPDPGMFSLMSCDYRFEQGESHLYDILLDKPDFEDIPVMNLNAANA